MALLARTWNHNTHYHRRLHRLVPAHGDSALDIGCGDGSFARLLATRCSAVMALDRDPGQVARARGTCAETSRVSVVLGDFRSADLPVESFDVVTALASVHHIPFDVVLTRMRALLQPGGRLIVLGVWTDNNTLADRLRNRVASLVNRVYQRVWGPDVMAGPAVPPAMSFRDVRSEAARLLPGATVRRCLLWRYILTWQRPATDSRTQP